jgi:hypothetical protein
MSVLLAILILTVAAPASAGDAAALFLPFCRALSLMMPPERNYAPGLRESEHVEDRRESDKEWPVERIPLPAPSRDLRPLLPLPGGRLVTDTTPR